MLGERDRALAEMLLVNAQGARRLCAQPLTTWDSLKKRAEAACTPVR